MTFNPKEITRRSKEILKKSLDEARALDSSGLRNARTMVVSKVAEVKAKTEQRLDDLQESRRERKAVKYRLKKIKNIQRRRAFKRFKQRVLLGSVVGLIFLGIFIYYAPSEFYEPATTRLQPVTNSAVQYDNQSESPVKSYYGCVARGIRYYKDIGSYPYLSTGEDAETKLRGMCRRSIFAFGS